MNQNESALNFTNYEINKDEFIPHEESFLSKLNLLKPDSVIISNPNLSFCEENGGTKKEFNNINNINFSKTLPNFDYDSSEEEEESDLNNRRTIGPCKRVKFMIDTDSIDIFGKDPVHKMKSNTEIIRKVKDVNATPHFKKVETRSNSSHSLSNSRSKSKLKNKNISRSIDDKYKQLTSRTKDNINNIKLNLDKRDKSSGSLKSRTQSELKNYFSTGNNLKNNNIKSLTSHSLRASYSNAKYKILKVKEDNIINYNTIDINENPFSDKAAPIISIINNQTKNNLTNIEQIKKLFNSENFEKKLENLKIKLSETQENTEKLYKEKLSEILIFVKNLYDEKIEKIFEIHQKYDNDLNKLEDMLDPADVHNISHKIYHSVLEDKQQELREVELDYTDKKSKGIEQIERNFEGKYGLLHAKNDNNFKEFQKDLSQEMIQQITKILQKNENTKNPRKNYSLTNIKSINNPSNGLETKEKKIKKSKRNKPAFRI